MDGFDIHNIERQFEQFQDKLKNSLEISNVNRKDILDFQRNCFAEGIGTGRILKYSLQLFTISKWLPVSFKEATKEHIIDLVQEIERKRYSEWTKHDYKVGLKKFYKWLRDTEEGYPIEVRWMKTGIKNSKKKLPEELLDVEDVKKLIESAQHPRDKAFVSMLYESGARIGEILTLRIKHVEFDDYGVKLMVSGKTGMRRVRIIGSVSYLSNWLNYHPYREDPESPLWLSIGSKCYNKKIKYRAMAVRLMKIAKRAGVKKRVNPHSFRHARASHLAQHLSPYQLNQLFGWTQGSDMAATYVHLSGKDVDDALLVLAGKKKRQDSSTNLETKECPRCKYSENGIDAMFCGQCGCALSFKAVDKAKDVENKVGVLIEALMSGKITKEDLAEMVKNVG